MFLFSLARLVRHRFRSANKFGPRLRTISRVARTNISRQSTRIRQPVGTRPSPIHNADNSARGARFVVRSAPSAPNSHVVSPHASLSQPEPNLPDEVQSPVLPSSPVLDDPSPPQVHIPPVGDVFRSEHDQVPDNNSHRDIVGLVRQGLRAWKSPGSLLAVFVTRVKNPLARDLYELLIRVLRPIVSPNDDHHLPAYSTLIRTIFHFLR